MFELSDNDIIRFWNNINIADTDSCWNWKKCVDKDGYGKWGILRRKQKVSKTLKTHRVSYQLTYGRIPEGLVVCHKCDNPRCCNPYHLFLGTQQDNLADMTNKGRRFCKK